MAHQELGYQLAQKIKADLATTGHIDQEPKLAGRNINMQMTPLPEKQRVRKFANFKHGRFIDPEEEDNTHEHEDGHGHEVGNESAHAHDAALNGQTPQAPVPEPVTQE